jgi:glutaminyl-peptide cyclotransferase
VVRASEASARAEGSCRVMMKQWIPLLLALSLVACAQKPAPNKTAAAQQPAPKQAEAAQQTKPSERINAARTMKYIRDIVAFGRRAPGSVGMKKQQAYIRQQLKGDRLEEDTFTADTPAGKFQLTNVIAKYPGTTDQVIVIASHYDTNYSLKDYVGANDGASSTAMLLELANHLRGQKLTGPSVWLVWFDGEEAFKEWSDTDSLYGSRHLAAKWKADGTAKRIKAFILLDMIGDSELNIDWDENSTPWLRDMMLQSATKLTTRSHFFERQTVIDDDHVPFLKIGVPVLDIIDLNYGYDNVFHHTSEDTIEKLSPKSLQIVGDVVLDMLRQLSR